MFLRESQMASSVARWLETDGLQVKHEFVTPWGICDLVGLKFNAKRVARRLRLNQNRAVSSITRAAILLCVPEVEQRKSISLGQLASRFESAVPTATVAAEVDQLIEDRFIVRTSRGRLQKMNGWLPLQDRLVAVELKLNRIDEARRQAKRNLGFAQESYVAFPMPLARRIASAPRKWREYFERGIGLIGVQHQCCVVMIAASHSPRLNDDAIRLYCVEKFWRTRVRI